MISLKRLKLLSLAVLVIGTGWLAVGEIRERGALASKQLAMVAREAIGRGEHDLAMLLALEGLPAGQGQLLAMDSLQARFALNEARQKNGLVGLFADESAVSGFGLFGPAKPFKQKRVSSDGKMRLEPLCEAKYRCMVDIIMTETNTVRASIKGHSRLPPVATFDKSDKIIITGSDVGTDGNVWRRYRRYALEYEGKPGNSSRISEDGSMYPGYFLLSPDGNSAYMVQQGSEALFVWDLSSDFPVTEAEFHSSPIVGFFPRLAEEELVLVSRDGLVSVWPLNADRLSDYQAKPIRMYRTYINEVAGALIASDNGLLKVTSSDGRIALLNLADGYPPLGLARWDVRGYIDDQGMINANGRMAGRLIGQERFDIFDVQGQSLLGSITFDREKYPSFILSPNGRYVAQIENFGPSWRSHTLRIWEVGSSAVKGKRLNLMFEHKYQNKNSSGGEAIFDRHDKLWFFGVDDKDSILSRWDPSTNSLAQIQVPKLKYDPEFFSIGLASEWSNEDGEERLGYFSFESEEVVLLAEAVNRKGGFQVPWEDLEEPALTKGGQILHARAQRDTGEVFECFWSTRDGKFLGSLPVDTYSANMVVTDAGRVVVAPEDDLGELFVGDLISGNSSRWSLSDFGAGTVTRIGAEADYVVMSKGGLTAIVLDVERRAMVGDVISLPSKGTGFAVDLQRGFLSVASEDGMLRIWSLATGDLLGVLSGHGKGREDGHLVDGWWDHHFSGPHMFTTASLWSPQFTDGGQTVIAESSAYGFEIWNISHDDAMITSACSSLSENRRSLTAAEYTRYGLKPREKGPCDRLGPLSPDFWREKAESLGFLQ